MNALVLALVIVATTAHAEPSPNAVRLEYGVGGPSGYVGARYVRRFGSLSIEPAVGYAATGPGGSLLLAFQLRDPDGPEVPIRTRKVGLRPYVGVSSFRTFAHSDQRRPPKGQYYWLDLGVYMHTRLGPVEVVGGLNLAFLVGGPNRDGIGEGDDDFGTIGFLFSSYYVKEGFAPGVWGGFQY